MKKYITEKSEDFCLVDKHTGEILDYNQTRRVSLEEFIMVFCSSYPEIMKLEGQKLKVLMLCWKHSNFTDDGSGRGNLLVNNFLFKEEVRKHIPKMSNENIDACLSILKKKGFLLKVCRGTYELNPKYFFKGRLSKRRSRLKLSFEVDPECTDSTLGGEKSSACFFSLAYEC